MSWHPPSPDAITLSPGRAALAVLAAAVAVARNALYAAHRELPLDEADEIGPPSYTEAIAEVLLGQLDAIEASVRRYERADDLATRGPFRAA